MRGIGFNFQKGRIRLTCLSRDVGHTTHEASRAITIDAGLELPELMDRYASHFRALTDEYKPDLVAVRQIWDSKNLVATTCQIQPIGILAYVSYEKGLPLKALTPQALRQPRPFNLPKGTNPISAVDGIFGVHPPYWDDIQKGALLAVWRALLES